MKMRYLALTFWEIYCSILRLVERLDQDFYHKATRVSYTGYYTVLSRLSMYRQSIALLSDCSEVPSLLWGQCLVHGMTRLPALEKCCGEKLEKFHVRCTAVYAYILVNCSDESVDRGYWRYGLRKPSLQTQLLACTVLVFVRCTTLAERLCVGVL